MTDLWKNIMFIRHMLRICVVLHISSSFHKCADCALVIKPQDTEAVSGEVVTLNCASSVSGCGNIAWITKDPETFIYASNSTASSVSNYITVDDRNDGGCNLNITASLAAAKKYFCKELNSEAEAGAELVVIGNNAKCTHKIKDGSHSVNCSIESAGKWTPTVACEELNEAGKLSGLQGNQTMNLHNNLVTSYWHFIGQTEDSCNIISCSSESKPTGRPKTYIETDCPLCGFREIGLRLRKHVLNSNDDTFWTHAIRCFPDEIRYLLRGYDQVSTILPRIGCSFSVLALILTLIICRCTWKQSNSAHQLFLPNLCVALLIADIDFMVVITDVKSDCKAVVGVLHYFLLAASFIMLAEGVDLLLYVKARREFEIRMLLIAAWVIPIIFVGLYLGISKVKGIDNGLVCWLSDDSFYMRIFCGFVLLVVMVDIACVVTVMTSRKVSIPRESKNKKREIRSALWNIGVTCPLLCFGSFFYGLYNFNGSIIFPHLFVVATSLQGPLIFIFHGIFNNKKMNSMLHCGSLLSKENKDDTQISAQVIGLQLCDRDRNDSGVQGR